MWKTLLRPEIKLNDPDLPRTRSRQMTAEQTEKKGFHDATLPKHIVWCVSLLLRMRKTNLLTEAHVTATAYC